MKYKVGDKVRVREDLVVDKKYGKDFFVSEMFSFKGQIVTIKTVNENKYTIEEDCRAWSWTDEMFEKISEDFIPKESILQSTISKGESSSDIITVKTTKTKLLLL